MTAEVYGTAALPLDREAQRCQASIFSGTSIVRAKQMAEQQTCQVAADAGRLPDSTDCTNADPHARVVRSLARATTLIERSCDSMTLGVLDTCAADVAGVRACAESAAFLSAERIFEATFPPLP